MQTKEKISSLCKCGSKKHYKDCCMNKDLNKLIPPTMLSDNEIYSHLLQANKLYETNQFIEAEKIVMDVLKVAPNNPHALNLFAHLAFKAGNQPVALFLLQKAIDNDPNNHFFHFNMAFFLDAQREISEELDSKILSCLSKTIELKPDFAKAYYGYGMFHFKRRNFQKTAEYLSKYIELDPNNQTANYILKVVSGENDIETMPLEYVESLFDKYVDFENHLKNILQYDAPKIIAGLIAKHNKTGENDILDLGCGSGFMGDCLIANLVKGKMIGVDISENMIKEAEKKKIYTSLFKEDVTNFLQNKQDLYDIVTAMDLFTYIPKLDLIFTLIAKSMHQNGLFGFVTEDGDDLDQNYVIRKSGRSSHSKKYIDQLLSTNGFEILEYHHINLRKEGSEFLKGHLYLVKKT